MSTPAPHEAPGMQPPVVDHDRVIAHRFHTPIINRVLSIVIEEGFIEPDDIPAPTEKGITPLTPALAAFVALGLGVLAEEATDPTVHPFVEQRALAFGEAALQAGDAQVPPFAETDPALHFELGDMVNALRVKRVNQESTTQS